MSVGVKVIDALISKPPAEVSLEIVTRKRCLCDLIFLSHSLHGRSMAGDGSAFKRSNPAVKFFEIGDPVDRYNQGTRPRIH